MDPFEILLLLMMLATAEPSLSTKTSRSYKVMKTSSTCTSQEVNVNLEMNRPFRGVVYAKGFPLEKNCKSYGTNETSVGITLSASGCGVRLVPISDEKLSYTVSLTVQMDRFLQQINDIEVTSSCDISPDDMTSPTLLAPVKSTRTGRNQGGSTGVLKEETLKKIRTWMEIGGTSDSADSNNRVSVGEQTMVLIKTYLPDGVAANVVDCYAHDGTGEITQRLVDEKGCSLDENIMPSLEVIREDQEQEHSNEITWEQGEEKNTREERNRAPNPKNIKLVPESALQVMGTIFYAFKFPDAAILHLKCTLQICKQFCPEVSCTKEDDDLETAQNRAAKSFKKKEVGEIIDRIEVFNSVEVVAPGIDTDGFSNSEDDVKSDSGEKTLCLSVSKMAFSFAITGAIFLCAVLAALWTVMRNRGRKLNHAFDGSEQILVVRDSPLNFPRNKPNSWTYS